MMCEREHGQSDAVIELGVIFLIKLQWFSVSQRERQTSYIWARGLQTHKTKTDAFGLSITTPTLWKIED